MFDLLPQILRAAPPAALYLLARFPELALAGGLPRDAAAGVEPRDADLVIAGPPSPELRDLLKRPGEWLEAIEASSRAAGDGLPDPGDLPTPAGAVPVELLQCRAVETERAVTLIDMRIPVQIIRAEHASVAAALASFDFGICQVAVRLARVGTPSEDVEAAAGLPILEVAEGAGPATARLAAALFALPAFARDLPGRWLRYASPEGNDAAGSIRRALSLLGRGHGWKLEPRELQRMFAAALDRAGAADGGIVADLVVAASGPPTASSAAAVREAMRGALPEPDLRPIPTSGPAPAVALHYLDPAGELAYLDPDAIAASAVADHGPAILEEAPEPFELPDDEPEDLFGAGAALACAIGGGACGRRGELGRAIEADAEAAAAGEGLVVALEGPPGSGKSIAAALVGAVLPQAAIVEAAVPIEGAERGRSWARVDFSGRADGAAFERP